MCVIVSPVVYSLQKRMRQAMRTNNSCVKLNTLLRENLSNPDLNVPFIASAMAMSRTTLYSKFSHLSDVSVGDYVIRFRMVEASRLLSSHKDMSIQEVADRVGFSSARYFSTAFKQSYGVTPTEYRRNN